MKYVGNVLVIVSGVIAGSMYISLLSLFDIDSKIALTVTVVYGFLVICFLKVCVKAMFYYKK